MTGTPYQAAAVTVVIAAKNEALTIEDVVHRCREYAGDVIVVDGHSTDATANRAASAGARIVTQNARPGKGVAMRLAIPLVSTPITVFVDGDGSHVPEDIPRLVEPIVADRADHVSASRLIGGSSELHGGFDEFLRLSGSALVTTCINWRFGVRLSDSQNGFRAIRTPLLAQLNLQSDSTTIEQEMIIQTLRLGARLAEVGSHEHPRLHGASHIRPWRAAPAYLWSLARHLLH